MSDRVHPLEKLKYATAKVAAKCADDGAWDKWARRFLMGIDNSIEAATKAAKKNDALYEKKFPPEPKQDEYKLDDYPDAGNSGWAPSYYPPSYYASSSPPPAPKTFDPEEEDDKPSKQQLKNRFVARSAICRAVAAWGESTMVKPNDPAKDDILNEMENELRVVDSALSDL